MPVKTGMELLTENTGPEKAIPMVCRRMKVSLWELNSTGQYITGGYRRTCFYYGYVNGTTKWNQAAAVRSEFSGLRRSGRFFIARRQNGTRNRNKWKGIALNPFLLPKIDKVLPVTAPCRKNLSLNLEKTRNSSQSYRWRLPRS